MSARPLPRPQTEPEPTEAAAPSTAGVAPAGAVAAASAAPTSAIDADALAASDAEGWALLESLRRRLDDQSMQGRKTQQQVTQLAESLAALVAEQRSRSKLLNLNSFVAYLIFTLLVGAGFFVLYQSRANELVDARDDARRERDLAVKRADDVTSKLAARERVDALAWDVYQLLEAGKRTDAVTKLDALREQPLSRTERAVLAARAHETHVVEIDAALKAATASFKAGRHGDVIAPLEAALVSEPAGARAAAIRYFLGVAYAKTNQLDKAISHLTAAVAANVDHDDARFQLASALDRAGQYAKARAEYDRFATARPTSSFAAFAMRRSATLARMPAVAPAPARPGSPTAGNASPRPRWPAAGSAAPPKPPVAKPPVARPPAPKQATPPAPTAPSPSPPATTGPATTTPSDPAPESSPSDPQAP